MRISVLLGTLFSRKRTRAERSLRLSEAHLNGIIASAMDAIITVDEEQRITVFNAAAEKMFMCPAAEAIGQPLDKFIPRRLRAVHRKHVEAFGRTGTTTRAMGRLSVITGLRSDGTEFPIEATISQVEAGGQKLYTAIVRDVTERRRAEEERNELLLREQEARAQAEAASRAKDEFLAVCSHELRTPLTAMLGWIKMLRAGGLSEEKQQRGLQVIERNVTAQARLIDDLLEISRIISKKLLLDFQTVRLKPLIEAALDAVRPSAELRRVALEWVVAADQPVRGDAQRLQQVVYNLLTNAIKFTPPGGKVTARLHQDGSEQVIVVSDTGIGMEQDFLPFVFDRFRQADVSTTRQYRGLGLGLAIVRQLVELHNGTVKAESPGPGAGSTFSVRLPIAAMTLESTGKGSRRLLPSVSSAGHPLTLDGLRVLVVEDDADSRELLVSVLEQYGAQVTAAACVPDALELFDEFKPNLLVSDIGMPGEDGYALIRKIRGRRREGADVPAIALTAYAKAEDRQRALNSGFQQHIAKPIEPAELAQAIMLLAHPSRENGAPAQN